VVQDTVTSHMRDLPARHGISVKTSGRFPSERLMPDGSLETGTPTEARDLAMPSLRWWCLTVFIIILLSTIPRGHKRAYCHVNEHALKRWSNTEHLWNKKEVSRLYPDFSLASYRDGWGEAWWRIRNTIIIIIIIIMFSISGSWDWVAANPEIFRDYKILFA